MPNGDRAGTSSAGERRRWRAEDLDVELGAHLGDVGRVDLLGLGNSRVVGWRAQGGDEALELRRRRHLEDTRRLGSDLEGVWTAPRQPGKRPWPMHGLGVTALEPHFTFDDVEQLVLDVVAVKRRPEVLRTDELHDRHLTVSVFAGEFGREEVVEEMEVFAFVASDERR